MERLDRSIRNVWIGSAGVAGLALGAVLGVAVFLALGRVWLAALVVLLPPVVFVPYADYRYRSWLFEVHDDHLEIEYGVVRKVSVVIPYVRIQHIDTNRGPVERLLGLATLRVYTAGSTGADLGIPGLERARAEGMQAELKERAIESDQGADGV